MKQARCHARCAIMSSRYSAYGVIAGTRDKDVMQRSSNRTRKALDAVTRFLCVFALLLVSFAHRVPAAAPQPDVDLSAYALPDGTLPVICQSPSGRDDGSGSVIFFSDCEFCRLAGAAILPSPAHASAPAGASASIPTCTVRDPAVFPVHRAGAPTRGPPLI